MSYIVDGAHSARIKFLELLNDLGINVLLVDNTYYAYNSFDLPNYDDYHHLEFMGTNITDLIQNRPITTGADRMAQQEVFQTINNRKRRTRRFHRDTLFVDYSTM